MKSFTTRIITSTALVATLGLSVPAVAFASSTTTASTTTSASPVWTSFRASWTTFIDGLKSINTTYRASLQSARSTFSASMGAATTSAERQSARATLDAAVEAAMNVRVAAITAAGTPPTPPAGFNGTAYVNGIQAANIACRAAIVAAQSTFSQALASATTNAQRSAARAALKSAIDGALATRASALTALGTRPAHPGQPS